ncbi:hypothetical protein SERLA73DRAFT_25914, partial [Serpula lacrymans var. lacrymans S7.3]
PFATRAKWELARFLVEKLNHTEIDEFLKLTWVHNVIVRTQNPRAPMFQSAYHLSNFMEYLPKGPKWHSQTIKIEGYPTTKPMKLIWRDGLEVVNCIFANPVFANHMMLDPKKMYRISEDSE